MSNSVAFDYAIWLVPIEEQRTQLRSQIRRLAERHESPAFDPHATLCAGTSQQSLPHLCGVVDRFCAEVCPLSLAVNGIGHTDDYFSFLFLRLIADQAETAFQRAAAEFPDAQLPGVGPHLSLMYSDRYDEIDRQALIGAALPTKPRQIKFDRMQIITTRSGNCDVQNWEVRHSTPLGRLRGKAEVSQEVFTSRRHFSRGRLDVSSEGVPGESGF